MDMEVIMMSSDSTPEETLVKITPPYPVTPETTASVLKDGDVDTTSVTKEEIKLSSVAESEALCSKDSITIESNHPDIGFIYKYDNESEEDTIQVLHDSMPKRPLLTTKKPFEKHTPARIKGWNDILTMVTGIDKKTGKEIIFELMDSLCNSHYDEIAAIKSRFEFSKYEFGEDDGSVDTKFSLEDLYAPHILDRAHDILEKGDSFKYIFGVWKKSHVGDEAICESCLCSVASTYVTNTSGLHVKPSGGSGKGKSSAIDAFIRLLPTHKYLKASLSGKAAFYNPNLFPGTILYSDDVNLDETIIHTVKQCTSDFQDVTIHSTVVNGSYAEFSINPRVVWWMTSVDGFDDEQMGNRFLSLDVDCSESQDVKVYHKKMEAEMRLTYKDTVPEDVLICRCIYDILGSEDSTYNIIVPFATCIDFKDKSNRRNVSIFLDLIKSVALYNVRQREFYCDAYLATIEDYERAKEIYAKFADNNATNLTNQELDILDFVKTSKGCGKSYTDIANKFDLSETRIKQIVNGKYGDGGLRYKVPGFREMERLEREAVLSNFEEALSGIPKFEL
jgi:hypothetical protein